MSLRKQIIYRILSSALCILLLGGALAIWQARKSVDKEVDASSHLALQLIALSLDNNGVFRQSDDLSHLSTLQQTKFSVGNGIQLFQIKAARVVCGKVGFHDEACSKS